MRKIYHYYEEDECLLEPYEVVKESVTDSDWEAFVREYPDYKEEAFNGERRLFKYYSDEGLDQGYAFDVFLLTERDLTEDGYDKAELAEKTYEEREINTAHFTVANGKITCNVDYIIKTFNGLDEFISEAVSESEKLYEIEIDKINDEYYVNAMKYGTGRVHCRKDRLLDKVHQVLRHFDTSTHPTLDVLLKATGETSEPKIIDLL